MKVRRILLGAVTVGALASAGLAAEPKRSQLITRMQHPGDRPVLTTDGPVKAIHQAPGGGQPAVAVMAKGGGTARAARAGAATAVSSTAQIEVFGADEAIDGDPLSYSFSVTAGDQDLPPFTLDMEYSEGLSATIDPRGWQCTFGAPGHASCDWTTTLPAGGTTGTATFAADAQAPYGGIAECDPGRSPCTFVRATLAGVASGFASTAIVVNGNHPPVAVADTIVLALTPAPISVDVLANDSDPDGEPLTVSIAVPPTQGTTAVDPVTNHIVYTPDPSFSGSDTFRYRITDTSGAAASALVTVHQLLGSISFQSPVNDIGNIEPGHLAFRWNYLENTTGLDLNASVTLEPVAPAEFPALLAGTAYDPAQAVSDVSVFSGPGARFNAFPAVSSYGVLCRPNGPTGRVWLARVHFSLSPETFPNIVLETSYVVVARSGDGGEVPVHIVDDVVTTPVDTPILIHPLVNDDSVAGQPLSVTGLAIAEPFHFDPPFMEGTVQFADSQNGGVPFLGALYTPPFGFEGTTAFYYAASETPGGIINGRYDYAKVTVNVGDVNNHAPVASSFPDFVQHDTNRLYLLPALATDADGDPLTVQIVTPPAHGAATVQTDQSIVYVPSLHFAGTDSFQFKARDSSVESNVGTVSITVTNAPPVAHSLTDSVSHNSSRTYSPSLLVTDPEGDPVTIHIVTPPAHGTATFLGDSVLYVPAPHYAGPDSFQVSGNDGLVESGVGTVSITVTNSVPVANSFTDIVQHDGNRLYSLFALVRDADVDPLILSIVTQPAHGTIAYRADQSVVYAPDPHYAGPDSFQFSANDGIVDSNVGTISITVANQAPVARSFSDSVQHDRSRGYVRISLVTDGDGDPLVVQIRTFPTHGTASVVGTFGNQSIVYVPSAGYVGPDAIQFTGNDSVVESNVGTISITVTDAAPVLGTLTNLTVPELSPAGFTASAADTDGDPLTFSLIGAPAGAQIGSGTGIFSWIPAEAQGPGTYTFRVRVTDTASLFDERPITITVTEVNTAPTLTLPALPAHIGAGAPFGFTATASDPDVPANTLAFSLSGAPAGASIGSANGVFSWTPSAAQAGITYTLAVVVTDNGTPARAAQQSVTITVDPAAPTAALLVSAAPDRSNPQSLGGRTLRGLVYIFVGPSAAVTRARFWLDDPTRTGPPRQVENLPPFDLAGTAASGSAQALDTRQLPNGSHVVSAEVTLSGGQIVQLQATFTVANADPALLVSVSPNRSNARPLAAATVRNNVYVFLRPDPDATRVRFWLDTATSQPPHHTETAAPFDFEGTTANGNAAPFDTRSTARGSHVIRAIVDYPGGVSVSVSAAFLVTR